MEYKIQAQPFSLFYSFSTSYSFIGSFVRHYDLLGDSYKKREKLE